jgi:hypothetical protein
MTLPGKLGKHPVGVGVVGGLAEYAVFEQHEGVCADHDPPRLASGDFSSFAGGELCCQELRVGSSFRQFLIVRGWDHLEGET